MEYDVVWINEGFVLNDAEHLIMTSYVDLRPPECRFPITGLVRGCERKYALEDSESILVSNPSRFREYGEGLILDIQEGLAREESVVTTRESSADSTRQRAISDLNEAFDLLDRSMRLKYSESNTKTNTDTATKSFTYAKEWWVFCTSIRPTTDDWEAWRGTLPEDYDHVSVIGQPARFAHALAHMVADQLGPQLSDGSVTNSTGGVETEKTKHKTQWVLHGPVVYTDGVYDLLEGITNNEQRIAAQMFAKDRRYSAQQEYRFVVLNEGADKETAILQISGMMRDALKQTAHGLVRHARVPLSSGAAVETKSPPAGAEGPRTVTKQATARRKSAKREEWRFEAKGPDGEVLSSDGGVRESIKEQTVTWTQDFEEEESCAPSHDAHGSPEPKEPFSTRCPVDSAEGIGEEHSDEEVVKDLALEEFELDERHSECDEPAIPIWTATGRVYKSFEELLKDPTYPMSPVGKVWQEDINTPEEITKTYRAIDVLDMKMKDIEEQFRRDVASAGWYAMLCIRNIYGRLGDIVDTVSIERERFVVIRLKEIEASNVRARIVIAPSGAYAYSLYSPKEQELGYGGLEWGTTFFPLGSEVEALERFGWPKKVL